MIRQQLDQLGVSSRSKICTDGGSTISAALNIINAAVAEVTETESLNTTGETLGKEIKEIKPLKLLVLDFMMPKKNGLQVFEKIMHHIDVTNRRRAVTVISPRVIFCTAYSNLALKNHLNSKGVNEVFEKPFELESLQEQISLSLS